MANRSPATFAKRQREMEQKRRALEKRRRKEDKKLNPKAPGEEEPILRCMPILDEDQP